MQCGGAPMKFGHVEVPGREQNSGAEGEIGTSAWGWLRAEWLGSHVGYEAMVIRRAGTLY